MSGNINKEKLKKELNEEDSGINEGFLDSIKEHNTNYWGNNHLIIKGRIIVPQEKIVVKELDIK